MGSSQSAASQRLLEILFHTGSFIPVVPILTVKDEGMVNCVTGA